MFSHCLRRSTPHLLRHELVSTHVLGPGLLRRLLLQEGHLSNAYLVVVDSLVEVVADRSRCDQHQHQRDHELEARRQLIVHRGKWKNDDAWVRDSVTFSLGVTAEFAQQSGAFPGNTNISTICATRGDSGDSLTDISFSGILAWNIFAISGW